MSALLRIALPPLAQLDGEPLEYAWLDRRGVLHSAGQASLGELALQARGKPVELLLHPDDSLLSNLTLPPLPAARLADAVALGADTLLLSERESLQLVHGPRDPQGQVQLAWLEREALEKLLQLFASHGVKPRGLYPAPFFLPVQEHGCTATLVAGQLVVRDGLHSGWLHPMPEQAAQQLALSPAIYWLGADAAVGAETLAAEQRWLGPVPACNLLRGWQQQRAPARWGRALACCLLAMLVWGVGLQLQASRLAEQGQALQRQMVDQVREVFPQVTVVLNPLQQARKQRELRQNDSSTFAGLLQQAGSGMPFLAGNLNALEYDGSTLRLLRRAGAPDTTADPAWREALVKAGLEVRDLDGGWSLSGAAEEASDEP